MLLAVDEPLGSVPARAIRIFGSVPPPRGAVTKPASPTGPGSGPG
jgi:hypothetical protein